MPRYITKNSPNFMRYFYLYLRPSSQLKMASYDDCQITGVDKNTVLSKKEQFFNIDSYGNDTLY